MSSDVFEKEICFQLYTFRRDFLSEARARRLYLFSFGVCCRRETGARTSRSDREFYFGVCRAALRAPDLTSLSAR